MFAKVNWEVKQTCSLWNKLNSNLHFKQTNRQVQGRVSMRHSATIVLAGFPYNTCRIPRIRFHRNLFFILHVFSRQISHCHAFLDIMKPFSPGLIPSLSSLISYIIQYSFRDSVFSHSHHMPITYKLFAFYYLKNRVLPVCFFCRWL